MKVTYGHLTRATEFAIAMHTLVTSPCSQKTAYTMKKLNDALLQARKKIENEYQSDVLLVFSKKDEKGNVMHPHWKDENGAPDLGKQAKYPDGDTSQFVPAEGKEEELKAAHDAFMNREAEINRPLLTAAQLSEFKLSAGHLSALSDFLDESSFEAPVVSSTDNVVPINSA